MLGKKQQPTCVQTMAHAAVDLQDHSAEMLFWEMGRRESTVLSFSLCVKTLSLSPDALRRKSKAERADRYTKTEEISFVGGGLSLAAPADMGSESSEYLSLLQVLLLDVPHLARILAWNLHLSDLRFDVLKRYFW